MGFSSVKHLVASVADATPVQFDDWRKSWRAAANNGSAEPLLGFIARERGLAEDAFLQKLAQTLGWPFLDLPKHTTPPEARNKISTKIAFQYSVLPTDVNDGTLQVVVSDPFDAAMMNAVRFDARMPVQFALAPKAEIEKALKKYYGVGAETLDEMGEDEPMELEIASDKEITEDDQEASVIKFVNQIIWEAFKDRATDIHFEPAEDELRIRYRIDGILHQTPMPPQLKRYQAALISRIKVMSGMNISEKRLPQDGRINVRIKGEEIDIRVSTVPTVYGESVSLRLLTRGKIFLSLDKLGFAPQDEAMHPRNHRQTARHFPRHRPDRFRQIHVALRVFEHHQLGPQTHHHHRGAGRIRTQGHQPDRRAPGNRADVCDGPAPHFAPGPERDHGGRNPRPGDGGNRHPRLADRPPGVQHAAHERRAERVHAVD